MSSSRIGLALLVSLLVISVVRAIAVEGPLRLVEFEDRREWVTQKQLERLTASGINLFDVTDHPNLAPKEGMWEPIIPTECSQQPLVRSLNRFLSTENLFNTISSLSSYHTRYYISETGVEAAEWVYNQYKDIISATQSFAEVNFFNNTWVQPSIIARIPGDPTSPFSEEVVILGGHIDSIISQQEIFPPYPRSPGANDDASGSANVLEVFRVLVENNFQGKRTIEFHAYSAEEVGLRGSQAIAESYQAQGVKVAGMLQLDMTGSPDMLAPKLRMINDYNNAQLMTFLKTIADTYSILPWYNSECGYACSDHASWNKTGYYSCRVKENSNYPEIHTSQDLLSNIWLPYSLEFAKIALGFLVEMSLDVPEQPYY